jgi:glucuronate isomerase
MTPPASLEPHPDRLLPSEPGVRAIARRLYEAVRIAPIVSPHGHVDPRLLLDDDPFPDPATLLVTPDHYVTRLLHASLCTHWEVYRGTPVRYWLESELADIFEVSVWPSALTADVIYDQISDRLADEAYRPRALYERFGIAVLATTDDPCDDLAEDTALAGDPPGRAGWFRRSAPMRISSRRSRDGRRGSNVSARRPESTPAPTTAW